MGDGAGDFSDVDRDRAGHSAIDGIVLQRSRRRPTDCWPGTIVVFAFNVGSRLLRSSSYAGYVF